MGRYGLTNFFIILTVDPDTSSLDVLECSIFQFDILRLSEAVAAFVSIRVVWKALIKQSAIKVRQLDPVLSIRKSPQMLCAIRRPVFNRSFLCTLVKKSMEKHQVVPDVVDVAPKEIAEVITNFCNLFIYLLRID